MWKTPGGLLQGTPVVDDQIGLMRTQVTPAMWWCIGNLVQVARWVRGIDMTKNLIIQVCSSLTRCWPDIQPDGLRPGFLFIVVRNVIVAYSTTRCLPLSAWSFPKPWTKQSGFQRHLLNLAPRDLSNHKLRRPPPHVTHRTTTSEQPLPYLRKLISRRFHFTCASLFGAPSFIQPPLGMRTSLRKCFLTSR